MTTYGEGCPVLFRIAHQHIAQVPSNTCDHLVLIDLDPEAQKEARIRRDILEKLDGKMKPRVALRNTRAYHPPVGRFRAAAPKSRKDKRDIQKSRQRRIAIERHNRNAAELSKHYIEWHPAHIECKDCGCRSTEANFKTMTEAQCEWHQGMQPRQADISTKRRLARRTHITNQCIPIRNDTTTFTWLEQGNFTAATKLSAPFR